MVDKPALTEDERGKSPFIAQWPGYALKIQKMRLLFLYVYTAVQLQSRKKPKRTVHALEVIVRVQRPFLILFNLGSKEFGDG